MRYSRKDPRSGKEEIWAFVEVAVDPDFPDDASKCKHVMRSGSGQTCHFPSARFPAEFRLVTAAMATDATAPHQEVLANIRHNSTVRFAGLPFFLTAFAVLADARKEPAWQGDDSIAWFGLGLAIVATVIEITVSRNLICWWKAIRPRSAADPWQVVSAHRSDWILWPARILLLAPYLAAIHYWLATLPLPAAVPPAAVVAALIVSVGVWSLFSEPAHYRK